MIKTRSVRNVSSSLEIVPPAVAHRPALPADSASDSDSDNDDPKAAGGPTPRARRDGVPSLPPLAAADLGLELEESFEPAVFKSLPDAGKKPKFDEAQLVKKNHQLYDSFLLRAPPVAAAAPAAAGTATANLADSAESERTILKLTTEELLNRGDGMDLARNRGDRKEKKIIELSKQIRKLNVALERERAAVSRMASRIKDLEASQAESTRQEPVPSDEKPAETKLLKERVAQLVRKVEEERIQSQSLRSELRHAQKCLVAEVGDEVAASKALNMSSGWKGRAQQIAMLKEKIRELSSSQQQCCHKCSEADPQNPLSDGSPDKEPDKARASLKKIELLRRQEFEKATQELQVLHSANSDMKKKNEASTARIKYLEKQMIDLKSKLELLLDKSGKDAALIKALQDELDKGSQKPPAEDIVVRNLTILCAEQKEQIQQLEEQMQALQRADQGQQLVGQDQSAEGYQSTIRSLTQENERIRRGKKLLEEQLAKWRACANGRGSPAVDDYDL